MTKEQELALGAEIHQQGKMPIAKRLDLELRGSNSAEQSADADWTSFDFMRGFAVISLIVLVLALRSGGMLLAAGLISLAISATYFSTYALSRLRIARWLDDLERQYSEEVSAEDEPARNQLATEFMTKKLKVLAIGSVVWTLAILAVSIDEASGSYYGFRTGRFVTIFIPIGIIPNVIIWGWVWVRQKPK